MVNYKCPRCGYSNNIKTKYVNHLNRKNICNPCLSDNDLSEEYKKYNVIKKKDIKSKLNPIESKMESSESKMNPIESKLDSIESKICKKYNCYFCNKSYSTNSNLNKHLKKCQEKDIDLQFKKDMLDLVNKLNSQLSEQKDQLTKQQEEFKKQLEKRDQQIDILIKKTGMNISNSTITQNIQQNIKLLAYKNTDISHLTDQDYLKCINHSNFCVPHLIQKIHFNPEKPENHNIFISNIKNKYIMTYDGKKWNLNNQDETINDLIDSNEFVLEQKLEEWIENGKDFPEIMNKFNRYLEKKENDDIINKIKEEIKFILFNNRKMISI